MYKSLTAAVAAIGIICPAEAQQTGLKPQFHEEYSSAVNVSGELLVGVSLGEMKGPVALEDVSLILPRLEEGSQLCLKATTRDGQYWASGDVTTAEMEQGASKLDYDWQYSSVLSRYDVADFAMRVRLGENCNQSTRNVITPIRFGEALTESGVLVAMINSQRALRTKAQLSINGTEQPGVCETSREKRSTAFDTVCRFELPPQATSATLSVSRILPTGASRKQDFEIDLAGNIQ